MIIGSNTGWLILIPALYIILLVGLLVTILLKKKGTHLKIAGLGVRMELDSKGETDVKCEICARGSEPSAIVTTTIKEKSND